MSEASARRKPNAQPALLDTELEHLPAELRWREWMGRVEAVIFAASEPVTRSVLARVVGKNCNLELIIDDIRAELAGRPYELVSVAGGWQHRTKKVFGDVIHAAFGQQGRQRGKRAVAGGGACPYVHCLFPTDHPGRVVELLREGGVARPDRRAARARADRVGTPQPAAGGALYLCDDQKLSVAVRARYATPAAGFRGARGRRAAVEGKLLAGDIPVGLASREADGEEEEERVDVVGDETA